MPRVGVKSRQVPATRHRLDHLSPSQVNDLSKQVGINRQVVLQWFKDQDALPEECVCLSMSYAWVSPAAHRVRASLYGARMAALEADRERAALLSAAEVQQQEVEVDEEALLPPAGVCDRLFNHHPPSSLSRAAKGVLRTQAPRMGRRGHVCQGLCRASWAPERRHGAQPGGAAPSAPQTRHRLVFCPANRGV